MADKTSFPRVLFVTSHAFNHHTGGGVTFSNLFAGWPKDRLATVHNDPAPTTSDVCERYFVLGTDEIRKRGGLSRLVGPSRPPEAATARDSTESRPAAKCPSWPRRSFAGIRGVLFGDAEFPEAVHLSPRLRQWVADFQPEVLYTILGNNSLMRLVDLIRAEFDLPLVVHFMDDWKSTAYGSGLLSSPRRRTMLGLVDRLVRAARVRMAIGEAMSAAYGQAFGIPFVPFQNAVDPADWPEPEPSGSTETFTLFYGGAILPFAQLESLADTCRAVDRLHQQGLPVRFDIYAPPAMTERYRARLAVGPAIRLHPPQADHTAYIRTLRDADLLVLPINFDEESCRFIRYSMPTKVPEYLFSGVPVLVYGPPDVAQVEYARAHQWGHIVTDQGADGLATAIRRLAEDDGLRRSVVGNALTTARRNHDATGVRERFRAALVGALPDS